MKNAFARQSRLKLTAYPNCKLESFQHFTKDRYISLTNQGLATSISTFNIDIITLNSLLKPFPWHEILLIPPLVREGTQEKF